MPNYMTCHLTFSIYYKWLENVKIPGVLTKLATTNPNDPSVDIGSLCTSYCLKWYFFSDYFSCFLSRLIRWFMTFGIHCFSLFALLVDFSSSVSLLFSLWHWAQVLHCGLSEHHPPLSICPVVMKIIIFLVDVVAVWMSSSMVVVHGK